MPCYQNQNNDFLTFFYVWHILEERVETWPSGKAEACKAFIPGSNPGVSFFIGRLVLNLIPLARSVCERERAEFLNKRQRI